MNFLLHIIQTIIIISFIIVIAWGIEKIVKTRVGYLWRKWLWLLLAVRLILPFPISISQFTGSVPEVNITVPMTEQGRVFVGNTFSEQNPAPTVPNDHTEAVTTPVTPKKEIAPLGIAILLWINGAVIALCLRYFQYRKLRNRCLADSFVCESEEVKSAYTQLCKELRIDRTLPVRAWKDGQSPMLLGYFKTTLLLPDAFFYSDSELDAVLRHELTHLKSGDLWYKLLMVIVCDIYWFNPIFRLMKSMAFRDVEYVCDEKATLQMVSEAKINYGNVILKTMSGTQRQGYAFTTRFAANKKTARERLENIFSLYNRKAGAAILLTLVLLLGFGTACVSVNTGTPTEAETQSPTEENISDETEPAESAELFLDSNLFPDASDAVVKEFKNRYPDYNVSIMEYSYYAEGAAGKTPDIFEVPNCDVVALGVNHQAADLTDILEARGWLNQMSPSIRAAMSDNDGRIYGIPYISYAFGLLCNTELFEAAGLTDDLGTPIFPKTWQEAAEMAVQIKEATGEAGFCLLAQDYAGAWQFINIAWNFGATDLCLIAEDGTYTANLNSDAAIEAMKFVKALKWDYGVLTEKPEEENYSTGLEHIGKGTAAMHIAANDAINIAVASGLTPNNFALGAVPAGPDGTQYSLYGGSAFVFSPDAAPEEINAALTLIELMGKSPVLDETSKGVIDGQLKAATVQNVPAIPQIPVWGNSELADYEQALYEREGTVIPQKYQTYFDSLAVPGNLQGENIPHLADLYNELSVVLK